MEREEREKRRFGAGGGGGGAATVAEGAGDEVVSWGDGETAVRRGEARGGPRGAGEGSGEVGGVRRSEGADGLAPR